MVPSTHIYISKHSLASIDSIPKLAKLLDLEEREINLIVSRADSENFRQATKVSFKKDGTTREIYCPSPELRKVQKRIKNRIFTYKIPKKSTKPRILWPIYLYGSISNVNRNGIQENKDYIACSKKHCNAKSILKIDIKDFFNNIHSYIVEDIYRNFFKINDSQVLAALIKITCYDNHVVQGSLISSYIANLVFHDIEPDIVYRLNRKGLVYTRLVDDITISSTDREYDFSWAKNLIIQMLYQKDLPVNFNKTMTYKSNLEPLNVHGLRVNYKEPRLPQHEVSNIRAAVKRLESLVQNDKLVRVTKEFLNDYNRTMGRINKLKRVGHNQHLKLHIRLKKIKPLPSKNDIHSVIKATTRLKYELLINNRLKNSFRHRRWYYKNFEKLNLISRKYSNIAEKLRKELKPCKPDCND